MEIVLHLHAWTFRPNFPLWLHSALYIFLVSPDMAAYPKQARSGHSHPQDLFNPKYSSRVGCCATGLSAGYQVHISSPAWSLWKYSFFTDCRTTCVRGLQHPSSLQLCLGYCQLQSRKRRAWTSVLLHTTQVSRTAVLRRCRAEVYKLLTEKGCRAVGWRILQMWEVSTYHKDINSGLKGLLSQRKALSYILSDFK